MRSFSTVGVMIAGMLWWLGAAPTGATQSDAGDCSAAVTTASIDAADAAGIGTVLGNNDGVWVVDITTDVKGNLSDQVGVIADTDDWSAGRDVAALFTERDGRLFADLCRIPLATQLVEWQAPVGRSGDVTWVLGGDWGGYRTVGLDTSGSPVVYGSEPGKTLSIDRCNGGEVAELVQLSDGEFEVAVRSLADFQVVDSVPVDAATVGEGASVSCGEGVAAEVELLPGATTFTGSGRAPGWEETASAGLELSPPVASTGGGVVAARELSLDPPPTIGGWSPWLFVLAAGGGVAYLLRKAQDPEWRSSWSKPDNGRNTTGRRREDATDQGYFNR